MIKQRLTSRVIPPQTGRSAAPLRNPAGSLYGVLRRVPPAKAPWWDICFLQLRYLSSTPILSTLHSPILGPYLFPIVEHNGFG